MMGDKEEWGKGYAREASLRIIEYCFNELKISKITLGVIEKNKKAIKLYDNIGFKVERIIENKVIYQNEVCNTIRMIKENGE